MDAFVLLSQVQGKTYLKCILQVADKDDLIKQKREYCITDDAASVFLNPCGLSDQEIVLFYCCLKLLSEASSQITSNLNI